MSCMRLSTRSTVVLPQPEGPMKAVISLAAMSRSTSRTAVWPLYLTSRSRSSNTSWRASSGTSGGAASSGAPTSGIGACTPVVTGATLAVVSRGRVIDPSSVMTGSGGLSSGEERGGEASERGEDEHDGDEREGCAPGPVLRARERRRRVAEDLVGERRVRPAGQAGVGLGHDADREQQGRGLTRGPGHRQQ